MIMTQVWTINIWPKILGLPMIKTLGEMVLHAKFYWLSLLGKNYRKTIDECKVHWVTHFQDHCLFKLGHHFCQTVTSWATISTAETFLLI